MALIAHLSDPHFGTERPNVADALVRFLCGRVPDLLIVSGDITQRARRSQFRAARLFLDRIPAHGKLVIPGNHDIPLLNLYLRFLQPYANYAEFFGNDREPVYMSDSILAIGVDTTRYYRHVDGEVSAAQIERVCECLRRGLPGQLKLVVTHQPVYIPLARERKNLLHGHAAARRAWAEAGADCVLGGHIHLPYMVPVPVVDPGLHKRLWVIQAGTAVSTRTRAGFDNSINLLDYCPVSGRCIAERWDYSAAESTLLLAEQRQLQSDRERQ